MTVEAIVTGTGVPLPVVPDRAGAGALIRGSGFAVQVDAGRATTLRLAAVGQSVADLTALLLTHHHSDHLSGIPDLLITRWMCAAPGRDRALPVIGPSGPCATFLDRVAELWEDDVALRRDLVEQDGPPAFDLLLFEPSPEPCEVWRSDGIRVLAVAVDHPPVVPSVAYRFETESGSVVVSGDTMPCAGIERIAHGADVLIHEAVCGPLRPDIRFHSECADVGRLALRAGVRAVVLTHLIPPPRDDHEVDLFRDGVRDAGYEGEIIVARDLERVTI